MKEWITVDFAILKWLRRRWSMLHRSLMKNKSWPMLKPVMNLLLDQNVPVASVDWLRRQHPEWDIRHVNDLGFIYDSWGTMRKRHMTRGIAITGAT